jgi:hypothetical protein
LAAVLWRRRTARRWQRGGRWQQRGGCGGSDSIAKKSPK